MNYQKVLSFVAPGALVLLLASFAVLYAPHSSFGSVAVSNEYQATTTYAGHPDVDGVRVVRTGQGSLGSVVITGANTGLISIYNATTSDISQRSPDKASSTILIADFPASAAAGTYTFDVLYTDGLLIVQSGAEATSTITYR